MRRLAETWLGWMWCAAGLLAVSLLWAPATAVWAQEVVVVDFGRAKDGIPSGWELAENEGKADVALVPDGDGQVLRLRSNLSSFSVGKKLDIDLTQTPFLVWQWKVTTLPTGGDFRKNATNDQAAQLLVLFSWSFFKKEVIAYVWDSTAPQGTTGKDPSASVVPFLTLHTVVVESGDAQKGKWMTVTRNVVEDYKKLFGGDPDKVRGIRIQINSQHTASRAEAYWRPLTFQAHPGEPPLR